MIINLTYEASADTAPAGFKPCVQAAVDFLCARFQGGSPVNIQCGFGTVGGSPLGGGALGSSINFLLNTLTYASVRSAIIGKAHTANAISAAAASLPVSDPNGGGQLFVYQSLAKSLGLIPAAAPIDAFFGITATQTLDFSTVNGATPVGFSCFAIALHEASECLGRVVGGVAAPGDHLPLDFYSYSALNTRAWDGQFQHQFSINSGATLLKLYNSVLGRDFGDWDAGGDACSAASSANIPGLWSATDDIVMDALGLGFGPPFTQRLTWS